MVVGLRSPSPVHDKKPKHPCRLDIVRTQVAGLGIPAKLRGEGLVEKGAEAILSGVPDPHALAGANAEEGLEGGQRDTERAVNGPFPVDNAGNAARCAVGLKCLFPPGPRGSAPAGTRSRK